MASKNSWVYWLFRVYALCVVLTALLHAAAWVTRLSCLHRVANYVLAVGLGFGVVPLLVGVACVLVQRARRRI